MSASLVGSEMCIRDSWTPDGLLYEADPRHAEQLPRDLRELDPSGVRGISFPGYKLSLIHI
eukprot:5239515-Alexandrium_andersonii.AAC.1